MKVTYRAAAVLTSTALLGLAGLTTTAARADTFGPTTFESPDYTVGPINGQQGWSMTGSYDVAVANVSDFSNASGFGFGDQALRASDAVTSGSFGDQTFSPGLANPAGESPLTPAQHYFQASFLIGSTLATWQPGLHLSVSPDKGDGSRMSYLRFEDQADGIHVFFDDVTDAGPVGTTATFNQSDIATLDRTHAHSVKFDIAFVDGAGNDVAKIYIDGALVKTGTTWEDYYRYDPEQSGSGNVVPTVDKLLFRESGVADLGNAGYGFLIEGVTLASAPPCTFAVTGTTMTLNGNCVTDHTISIPNGDTLNGNGYTITAVDPAGGHFLGAVVGNGGTSASVTDLTVTAFDLANVCDDGAPRLRGILFDDAAGSITNNTVIHVNQGQSGCQEGNAIEVRNFTTGDPQRAVTISGNTVSDYQKNGITANGTVAATITNNTVTGSGPIGYIAQNGIQVGFGATALVKGNTASGNWYTGSGWAACGFLIYQAGGVRASSNTLFANQQNQCNVGKGGGKFAAAS